MDLAFELRQESEETAVRAAHRRRRGNEEDGRKTGAAHAQRS